MLKKQTQRRLALYFSAMIFLNGFFFWRSTHGITIGLSDFASFYTAAEILHDGRGRELYDLGLQEQIQRSTTPLALSERGAVLPYNHPAFEAFLFLPLVIFSYRTAYLIWLAINIGLVASVIILLRKNLPSLGSSPLYLWIAACLAFTPITVSLVQGQDSLMLLFCYCIAFTALRRMAEFSAGIWVALGLFKFQLSLPFVVPFLLRKRWRIVGGFFVAAILLLMITLKVVGYEGLIHYPDYIWGLDHNPNFRWLVPLGSPNLHGLISLLTLPDHPVLGAACLLVVSGMLLVAATFAWRTRRPDDPRNLNLAFAATLIVSVLLSYHILVHDLSVLFLALLLAVESTIPRRPGAPWSKRLIWVCALILWSPLILVLFEFHHLELLVIVFAAQLAAVLFENGRREFPAQAC
jgi:Glycosyltransferase family 87